MSKRRNQAVDAELEALINGTPGMESMSLLEALEESAKPRYNALIELDDGTTVDLSTIVRINKDRRFVPSVLGNSRFQFGIVINRDVAGKDFPNKDIEIWYEREDARDNSYNVILDTLRENGRNIVKLSAGVEVSVIDLNEG